MNRYVVIRKCIANEFVFVDADNETEAMLLAEQGDCDSASMQLEFVEHRPTNTWKAELLDVRDKYEYAEKFYAE